MKTPLPAVHGFCMGLAFALLVLLALIVNTAHAELWERAVVADEVAITVHVVTIEELRRKARTQGAVRSNGLRSTHYGWSVLYRTPAGELKCNVYVTRDASPETLEHEHRHCYGWVHR